jgi:hypothetical protein
MAIALLFTFIVERFLVFAISGELVVFLEGRTEVGDAAWCLLCVSSSSVSPGDVGSGAPSAKGVPQVYDRAAYFGLSTNAALVSVQYIGS